MERPTLRKEIVEHTTNSLITVLQKKEVLTDYLNSMDSRIASILKEESDLYEDAHDVAELQLYFSKLKKALKASLALIEEDLILLNHRLLDDFKSYQNQEENIAEFIRETYIPDDKAPF